MQIKIVQDAAARFLKDNATTVLTASGVFGTVATAVLSFRAGVKAERIIHAHEVETVEVKKHELSTPEKVKLVGVHILPPVASSGFTIAAIVMAHRMSATKAAALAAAYGVSQKQLDEYKAKVLEKFGETKTKEKVQDELAQERVSANPHSSQIIVLGDDVLCYDQPTDRYFKSTMETIKKAENDCNSSIIHHGFCDAQSFYDALGLEPTTWTTNMGWHQPFKLEITTTESKIDGRPCLAIDFDRLPVEDYVRGRPSQYTD